jgi:hypothetical protein
MAYDPILAERIGNLLTAKGLDFTEKSMMGGRLFSLDDKMLCGVHSDKKYGDSLLMARIGESAYEDEIEKEECLPMEFTGRPMRGYIFVTPDGFADDDALGYWLDLCVAFNPLAKASKKRKKKA